jgi:hypothetical protein
VIIKDLVAYPARIMASAWDLLGEKKNAIGFSGTKDTYQLLPDQVEQREPNVKSLLGTNGLMLHLLLENVLGIQITDNTNASVFHHV